MAAVVEAWKLPPILKGALFNPHFLYEAAFTVKPVRVIFYADFLSEPLVDVDAWFK